MVKSGFDKRDYYALQDGWRICRDKYLYSEDPYERFEVINDFRDSLVDIENSGKKALRSMYDEWETKEWIPLVDTQILLWEKKNVFDADDENALNFVISQIKQEFNPLRYRKIMQIIQDSGIGLGSRSERTHGVLQGFMGTSGTV